MDKLPAYPLMLIDPYFSLWTNHDVLSEGNTMFWTGAEKSVFGYVKTGDKVYRFMGGRGGIPLRQTDLRVTAFETVYDFSADEFDLTVSFFSPRTPNDLMLLSLPASLVFYEIRPKGKRKDFEITIFLNENCCYNDKNGVKGGVVKAGDQETGYIGLKRQMVLSNSQDSFSADWGYVYAAGKTAFYLSQGGLDRFVSGQPLAYYDKVDEDKYLAVSDTALQGKFCIAFDDVCSIYYFGQPLKGLYLKRHTIFDAIEECFAKGDDWRDACRKFDEKLKTDAGSKEHYLLLAASLRQSAAAHKLVEDYDGRLLFLSKECHSNGCIATVDVSYPSSPLYLLYQPELVWGMLEPIFDFASMPVWEFPFAPHDAGTYPLCTGQTYGLNNRIDKYACDNYHIRDHSHQETHLHFYLYPKGNDVYEYKTQMPVEECGNMLILTAAANRLCPKKVDEKRGALLRGWAEYLCENGFMPSNQLCTDDFAGHLEKNANLSLKAIVGIGAYSVYLSDIGESASAEKYRKKAKELAAEWEKTCYAGGREFSPLTMDGNGTYSLKYNLFFDRLLGLNLFSEQVYRREVKAALAHLNEYGTPLDERESYTKSDWLMWIAALAGTKKEGEEIIRSVYRYLVNTPSRVPFSDWYDAKTAKQMNFCNRTVQGGIFAILLKEADLLKRK